jgi:hypothetical protein
MIAITKREIAFIDRGVDDFATLFAGIRSDVEAIQLSNDEPAPRQMARAVQGREGLEAIHVIAHGRPGEVNFGAAALSPDTIIEFAAELAEVASDPLDMPSLTDSHSIQPILNFSHPSDCRARVMANRQVSSRAFPISRRFLRRAESRARFIGAPNT